MPCGASGTPSATERVRTSAARSYGRLPTCASQATTTCSPSARRCSRPTSTPTRATAGQMDEGSTRRATALPRRPRATGATRPSELFHASARDPVWEYVLGGESALATFELTEAPLVLVGHSHVPFAVSLEGTSSRARMLRPEQRSTSRRAAAVQSRLGGPAERWRLRVRPGSSSISPSDMRRSDGRSTT